MTPWGKIAALLVVVAGAFSAGWTANGWRLHRGREGAALAAAEQLAQAQAHERALEQGWQQKLSEVSTHAETERNALEADLAASRDAGERLRAAADNTARRTCPRAAAPAPGKDQPGSDPLRVFADVLKRMDERGRAVSEYADRLRIAGSACERAYDSVTR